MIERHPRHIPDFQKGTMPLPVLPVHSETERSTAEVPRRSTQNMARYARDKTLHLRRGGKPL
jgi:hypothetical protein